MYSISLVCNLYRLPIASLMAGLNSVPITDNFSVMSRERSIRERLSGYYRITVVAVISACPANLRSVSDSDIIVAGSAFILPRARHYLHASRQLASHLDWREPIGLQERLEGRKEFP